MFHGSESIVEKPVFGIGNLHNDYGLGFYCTTKEALAKEWGARKNGAGYVNVYSLRDDRFRILDLTKPPYDDVLHWVALLMSNREISQELRTNYPRELKYLFDNYLLDVRQYDVVIGYRADDSYFRFPEAFVRSEITFKSLQEIFKAGNLGRQYVLISEKAFKNIKFLAYYPVEQKYRGDYYSRKSAADKTFAELLRNDRYSSERRLIDLVRDHANQ